MMLLLSTGRQFLAPLANWVALGVLVLATYLIAGKTGNHERAPKLATVLIMLSIPIIEFQTFVEDVDLFGTAFLGAAVAFFQYRYSQCPRPDEGTRRNLSVAMLAVSALACGISVGTKPIYYLYGAIFVSVVFFVLRREHSLHGKSTPALMAIILVGVLLPSAFWFGRGLVETRNPVYPMQLALGRHIVFAGYSPSQISAPNFADRFVHSRAEWLIYPWTEWRRTSDWGPYNESAGFGGAFATFVPLGLLFALYRSLVIRRSGALEKSLLSVWVPALVCWYFLQARMPRFGLPLWVLACVLSTPLLASIYKFNQRLLGGLLLCSVVSTCAITTFSPVHRFFHRLKAGTWSRAAFYGYPSLIDDLPEGTRILNDTGYMTNNFPLAGKTLSNYVIAAAELPNQLTPEYVKSENVDYIVQMPSSPGDGVSAVLPIPSSITTTGCETLTIKSRVWRVCRMPH